jgi:hypothetical protein
VSAARALAIIAVLRAMSLFEGTSEGHESFQHLKLSYMRSELTEGANTVISFYSGSLATCVGPQFKPPSLEFLARQWFNASSMGFEANPIILLIMLSLVSRRAATGNPRPF